MQTINVFLFFIPVIVECYPITESILKSEAREENTFPNGTVVGKYSYVDGQGNPVQVKYYADDASYGVELKSFKMVEAEEPLNKQSKFDLSASDLSTVLPPLPDIMGSLDLNFPATEKNYKIPSNFLNEKNTAKTHNKEDKTNEYDLPRNYLNFPKTKGDRKDKVRIYYDNPDRIVREASNNYYMEDMPRVCDQF